MAQVTIPASKVTVKMEHFKECNKSHRFQESTMGNLPATIGNIYVPKDTLKQIGWEYGKPLYVEISV